MTPPIPIARNPSQAQVEPLVKKAAFNLMGQAELDLGGTKAGGPARVEVYARDDKPDAVAFAVNIAGVRWVTTLDFADASSLQAALRAVLLAAAGAMPGAMPGAMEAPPGPVAPEDGESSDRLAFDFEVSDTSPVVKGTWVTASHVVSLIVDGCTWDDILRSHPELTEADVRACVAHAMGQEEHIA